MKASRKLLGRLIVGCVFTCCLSLLTRPASAMEGLRVSIQETNAVLAWPSDPSESYIIQYKPTLTATSGWTTLTDYYPADSSTNITLFVDPNPVDFGSMTNGGSGGSGGGGGPTPPGGGGSGGSSMIPVAGVGFYQVVRDGVHLWGISNGMVLHDVLITPIEYAVGSTDEVVGVTFYDDNNAPIIGATAQQISQQRFLLVWNTTMSFNGGYNVYAKLNFANDGSAVSTPVSVTVSNTISFPNYFARNYGDQMWVYAKTIPNAAYQVAMYDENTNYLGAFSGNASGSGTISFVWDLTDGQGNTLENTNFFGVFTVNLPTSQIAMQPRAKSGGSGNVGGSFEPPVRATLNRNLPSNGRQPKIGGGSATAKQFWVKEPKWTPNNQWVIAFAALTDNSTTTYKENLMMLGGADGNYGGVVGTLGGNDFHGTLSPGNVPQTSAFQLGDATTRAQLLTYLADATYKNFYFLGHGNDSYINAYNAHETGISKEQMAYALANVPLSYELPPEVVNVEPPIIVPQTEPPLIKAVARHPYRFVFLDGCETGAGNYCESFGIPAFTVSTNYFLAMKVESRAFLGYKNTVNFNPSQWDYRALMLQRFLFNWESGAASLQNCVGDAQSLVNQPMDSSAIIYGAYDMRFGTRTRP